MEKRYFIERGTTTFYSHEDSINPTEYLNDSNNEFQINDGELIASFGNETEARAEFSQFHCDCTMTRTMKKNFHQCDCNLYYLTIAHGEYNENGEWEEYDIEEEFAPFCRETYSI